MGLFDSTGFFGQLLGIDSLQDYRDPSFKVDEEGNLVGQPYKSPGIVSKLVSPELNDRIGAVNAATSQEGTLARYHADLQDKIEKESFKKVYDSNPALQKAFPDWEEAHAISKIPVTSINTQREARTFGDLGGPDQNAKYAFDTTASAGRLLPDKEAAEAAQLQEAARTSRANLNNRLPEITSGVNAAKWTVEGRLLPGRIANELATQDAYNRTLPGRTDTEIAEDQSRLIDAQRRIRQRANLDKSADLISSTGVLAAQRDLDLATSRVPMVSVEAAAEKNKINADRVASSVEAAMMQDKEEALPIYKELAKQGRLNDLWTVKHPETPSSRFYREGSSYAENPAYVPLAEQLNANLGSTKKIVPVSKNVNIRLNPSTAKGKLETIDSRIAPKVTVNDSPTDAQFKTTISKVPFTERNKVFKSLASELVNVLGIKKEDKRLQKGVSVFYKDPAEEIYNALVNGSSSGISQKEVTDALDKLSEVDKAMIYRRAFEKAGFDMFTQQAQNGILSQMETTRLQ